MKEAGEEEQEARGREKNVSKRDERIREGKWA